MGVRARPRNSGVRWPARTGGSSAALNTTKLRSSSGLSAARSTAPGTVLWGVAFIFFCPAGRRGIRPAPYPSTPLFVPLMIGNEFISHKKTEGPAQVSMAGSNTSNKWQSTSYRCHR
jgi:hypothetical protein